MLLVSGLELLPPLQTSIEMNLWSLGSVTAMTSRRWEIPVSLYRMIGDTLAVLSAFCLPLFVSFCLLAKLLTCEGVVSENSNDL